MKKAIVYLGFSSDPQEQGSTIDRQRDAIKPYIERNGFELVETFTDDGYSASSANTSTTVTLDAS
jgi:DNA invertase Pin-like site-specific DNA recombinase